MKNIPTIYLTLRLLLIFFIFFYFGGPSVVFKWLGSIMLISLCVACFVEVGQGTP